MNLGFEVVAARSKKADANDDLAFEPMRQRARKEPRKQPSTDEKKVKRRLTKSAVAWSRRDSLDHDTEFVRYVLLSDTEALEASVIRDETTDEPTWAWLVSVIDRQDGGILEFVMSGSASGLDEAKGKADVALDRAEMDMMFERVGSRKQAASDHQETIWYLTGYLMGYNGDAQPDDDAPFSVMTGYSAGSDDLADNKPANYTRSDLDYFTETEDITSDDVADFFEKRGSRKQAAMPIMVPSIEDLPADREDMAWYEVTSQRRSSGQLVLEVEWAGHSATQAKRAADELLSDPDVMFVQLTRNAGRETYGVQMNASRKQAAKNWYVFDGYPDENGFEERPVAGPFASAEEASAALKDVAYPFQFPYGPATVVGDLFIASGLPQMDTQDFINQTLSGKQAGYRYQPDTESSFDVEQYDESPGEPFTNPSGHTYNGPEKAEATGESYVGSRSSSMQREADILEAMRLASLTEQRQLMAELNTIRANRTAARQADRDIDLTAAVIEDRLTPVLTKSMHTVATDWLTEIPTPAGDGDGTAREMVAQASVWFKRLSSEVVADRDEFAEQARGKARQLTSSLGEGRQAAIASFLDAAAHLRAKKPAGGVKTANELMGYDDGEYVTNAGDDMMMDDMSGMDMPMGDEGMDPRYETNASRKTAARPLYEIADEIRSDWKSINYGAAPYLDAMQSLTSINDMYYMDDAKSIVAYFLSNASSWKGETAKAVKAELKQMMKSGSRKHAEWDQSAFDAWMKQVDSKMVGMSGLGSSDLPDQPYADWFEDGMSASEAAQLSLSDTADEMGFGGLFGSRKQAMPRTVEVEGYTADELTGSARDRARQDWDVMQWDLYVADDISEYLNEELARKLPSFAGTKVVWDVGFSQGDGVWLETGPLSRQQVLDLGVDLPQGVSLEVVSSGAGRVNLEANYSLDTDSDEEFEIQDLRDAAETELNGVLYDLYGMARDYVMDAGSEEYWIDWADENDVLYDQSGRIIRQGSRKQAVMWDDAPGYHWATDGDAAVEIVATDDDGVEASIYDANAPGTDAPWDTFSFSTVEEAKEWSERIIFRNASRHKQAMPSDDLIDVDIEDYMGGDEGPDPDSQSGHAETALPYAGDDMTPAYRETGWTSKRRTARMSDEEWNRAVEVDTEDMIYFLQEFKQLGSQVAGMNAQQMHDWYYRNWDDLTDEYGLAIDPDMIDWEEVAARISKSSSRKRRATRKTSADMSSLEMYDSYYEQVADFIAGAKVDPSGSGVIVGGVSYKVMYDWNSNIPYLQASNGRTLSLDDAQVDPRVGMPFYGDVADAIEHMARNASRKRGSRKTAQKVRCPECGRVFDLMNESDADEWFSGHDCEG